VERQWLKDAWEAAKVVYAVRKSGEKAKLALVPEDELVFDREWLAQRDYENQLMQQTIQGMIQIPHISPCSSCEEHRTGECTRPQRMGKGCVDWWLRFLKDDEIAACKARAASEEFTAERREEMQEASHE
jgi:hypothetical protein